jgi:hypothetical protein
MTKSWHAQRLFILKIIQLWVFIAYTKMENDNKEQICIYDESIKDADITILKYFLQVRTPILSEFILICISWYNT